MKRALFATLVLASSLWTVAPNLSVKAESGLNCEPTGTAAPPSASVPDATSQQPALCPAGKAMTPTGYDVPKVRPLLGHLAAPQTVHAMTSTDACAAVAGTGANYCWASAYQYPSPAAQGASADFTQADPAIQAGDTQGHSLAEMWVGTTDLREAMEVGWGVFPGIFNDTQPHLWVYHWIDGVGQGYNTDFVPYVQSPHLGMVVPVTGTPVNYLAQYWQGNWWVSYGGTWFGYFPGSLWAHASEPFTAVGEASWYGEVESTVTTQPATAMGNGTMGSQSGAATISNIHFIGGPSVSLGWIPPTSSKYGLSQLSASGFRYGGPGYPAPVQTGTWNCPPSTTPAQGRPCFYCMAMILVNGVATAVCGNGSAAPIAPAPIAPKPVSGGIGTALRTGSPPYPIPFTAS